MPEPTETPRLRYSKGRAHPRLAHGLRLDFQTELPKVRHQLRILLLPLALRPVWLKLPPDGKDPGPAPASPNRRRFWPPNPATHLPLPACPQPRPPAVTSPPHHSVRSEAGTQGSVWKGNQTFSPPPLRPWTGPPSDDSASDSSRGGQN